MSQTPMIRKLVVSDYYKGHLQLYSQLATINPTQITIDMYRKFVNSLNENYVIFVVESNNKIVATVTLLIETKLIHDMGKVGHIEDVVVDQPMRNQGVGKSLILYVIQYAEQKGCYKTVLNCDESKIFFYEKCGMTHHGLSMSKYT